jgi:hypothetical protein
MSTPGNETPRSLAATLVPWIIVVGGIVALAAFVFGPFFTR